VSGKQTKLLSYYEVWVDKAIRVALNLRTGKGVSILQGYVDIHGRGRAPVPGGNEKSIVKAVIRRRDAIELECPKDLKPLV